MNIKILDSWLREYLKTNATPKEFAHAMSLTSVSIERMEKFGNDIIYDIEVTTNRPDLMSVIGLAREASAVLPQFGFKAEFIPPKVIQKGSDDIYGAKNRDESRHYNSSNDYQLTIKNNDKLVNRILAVILEVTLKDSPKEIKERLETSDIRSLNNVIDVTNYVMRVIGHPTHVFDYDRLKTKTLVIRESRNNERIKTLDGKEYKLEGGDIVAEDGVGNIVDLLGVMGLQNSVVTNDTKRIVFFIDNLDPVKVRKTSMLHGIRTEAAQLNEKNIDLEAAYNAMLYGIKLYKEVADAKQLSEIIDIYPNKQKQKEVSVSLDKINSVIGINIPKETSLQILEKLEFKPKIKNEELQVIVPSFRLNDIDIPEDLIEEIARVYGYHNIPTQLPSFNIVQIAGFDNMFYYEQKVKNALKYWGFTETYTYPTVSEEMYEGQTQDAVTLANPLGEEFAYMRKTLTPSLLNVVTENKSFDKIKIFEIGNVYIKKQNSLPEEIQTLAILIKKPNASFFKLKGVVLQICNDLGIKNLSFKPAKQTDAGADVFIEKEFIGTIEVLDETIVTCELNFAKITSFATHKKSYSPISKYPTLIEDLALIVDTEILTEDIVQEIKNQSNLIQQVSLLDKYQDARTFHIIYHSNEKNLTNEDVAKVREQILQAVKGKFNATIKK